MGKAVPLDQGDGEAFKRAAGRLIVVLTMARSRSSLTCELLHKHGVWSYPGQPPNQWNRVPYHEIPGLKSIIKNSRDNIYDNPVKSRPIEGFGAKFWTVVRNVGYVSGPLLVKVDSMAMGIFEPLRPLFVCLYRSPEGIMKSIERTPFMAKQKKNWPLIIEKHHEVMEGVGMKLDTDRMVNGDHTEFRAIVEEIGLPFKPEVMSVIQ